MTSLSPSPTMLYLDGISKPIPGNSHQVPDGIFKPISRKGLYISKGKFLGILVFNPLPPSDSNRHTGQSTSSGLRRLNRGSCHTPKFAHLILLPKLIPRLKTQRHTLLNNGSRN